jgi:hypothetical protein
MVPDDSTNDGSAMVPTLDETPHFAIFKRYNSSFEEALFEPSAMGKRTSCTYRARLILRQTLVRAVRIIKTGGK